MTTQYPRPYGADTALNVTVATVIKPRRVASHPSGDSGHLLRHVCGGEAELTAIRGGLTRDPRDPACNRHPRSKASAAKTAGQSRRDPQLSCCPGLACRNGNHHPS